MKVQWGPSGWKFLHAITFAYPEKPTLLEKKRYLIFFKSLRHVLPCPVCSAEYARKTRTLSLKQMKDRDTLSRWLVKVHNQVNFKLGKRIVKYSTVKRIYT
jgi:mitochondrial FAD-linked sulfhydryl oxidase